MKIRIFKEPRVDNVIKFHVQRWDWYQPWWRTVDIVSGKDAEQYAIKCAREMLNPLIVRIE